MVRAFVKRHRATFVDFNIGHRMTGLVAKLVLRNLDLVLNVKYLNPKDFDICQTNDTNYESCTT